MVTETSQPSLTSFSVYILTPNLTSHQVAMIKALSVSFHLIPSSKGSLMDDHGLPASRLFPLQPADHY